MDDKIVYKNRIDNINNVKNDYMNIQNNLNRTIKEYNYSINTYNRIKLIK